jgi:hypothetical protein
LVTLFHLLPEISFEEEHKYSDYRKECKQISAVSVIGPVGDYQVN